MTATMLFAGLAGNAGAALQAVGPIDLVSTLPAWYKDPAGLSLQPCLVQNGFCVLTPAFDPLTTSPPAPITTSGPINDTNFPDESFYFIAESLMDVGPNRTAKFSLRLAMEAAFLAGVVPSQGIVFTRINMPPIKSGLTPNSTFTVTHPYGSFSFSSDATGASVRYRTEDPLAATPGIYFPPDLAGTTTTHLGPFLKAATGLIVDPASGKTFIGNPNTPVAVTGSPNGNNFVRITGPNIGGIGINTIQTTLFTLAGQVYTGPISSPLTINRSTYSRSATSGQIDVFATALPNAVLTLTGAGIPATTMVANPLKPGKFTAHIVLPSSTLPTGLAISNSLDTPAPVPHPVTLVDAVTISQSFYDPAAGTLTVVADSADNVAPLPTLRVPALAAPNTLDAVTGKLTKPLATAPLRVTVRSSDGGSATAPVRIFTPAPTPVALADSATTPVATPVTIPVLANDTIAAPGVISPASVVISTPPLSGFAVANADGTATYIPAGTFTGPASFSYTVANTQGTVSNAGTVNVTVTAPVATAPAPVTVANTATTAAGTPVTINVLANDTIAAPGVIDTGSVVISSPPLNGTAIPGATGTVTFTPAAGFTGTTSFAYTVKNTQGLASNATTVTVTVTAATTAPAPVAVANTATTAAGTPVTINVLANDTIAAPGVINPASVVITAAPLNGTAVANTTGTVTFTPAAGFTGTTSFAYTVKNTQARASNAATVTVTVNAAAPAETIAANILEYAVGGAQWKIQGTTSNTTTHTMTAKLAGVVAGLPCNANGRVIGSVSASGGKYGLQVQTTAGSLLDPRTTNCNSVVIQSALGGVSPLKAVALK